MKRIIKLIGKVIFVLSLVFIVYAVKKLGFDFSGITSIPKFVAIMIFGVVAKVITVYSSTFIWTSWLSFFGNKKVRYADAAVVYSKANIGKYLPGNVMQYVGRNLYGERIGLSQKKIAASSIVEIMSLVLVAFITSLILSATQLAEALVLVKDILRAYWGLIIAAAVVGCLACAVIAVILIKKKLLGVLREYSLKTFLKILVRNMIIQSLELILLGVIFVALFIYMGGQPTPAQMLGITGGYIVSWVMGFVVPGSPGGIGVREAVLTLLVGPLVGENLILTIAVIHRLITIIGDFATYILTMIIFGGKAREEN